MEQCINSDCPHFGNKWCAWCYYYIPILVSDPTPEPERTKRQWDDIRQLQATVRHLNKKVTALEAGIKGSEY